MREGVPSDEVRNNQQQVALIIRVTGHVFAIKTAKYHLSKWFT